MKATADPSFGYFEDCCLKLRRSSWVWGYCPKSLECYEMFSRSLVFSLVFCLSTRGPKYSPISFERMERRTLGTLFKNPIKGQQRRLAKESQSAIVFDPIARSEGPSIVRFRRGPKILRCWYVLTARAEPCIVGFLLSAKETIVRIGFHSVYRFMFLLRKFHSRQDKSYGSWRNDRKYSW